MPDFAIKDVAEIPYIYSERTTGTSPEEISQAMGAAFGEVFAFAAEKGITPAGPPLSVYHDFSMGETMRFRAGIVITPEHLGLAEGSIGDDTLPAGRVVSFVHEGSYATLRDDYDLLMRHVAEEGLSLKPPSWELYLNDPGVVAEAELRTECCTYLG